MDREGTASARRPLLLLGRFGEALSDLARAPALRECFVVTTPRESAVEELIGALQPTAVLLEASEFYLEGRALGSRLRRRSRASRILFLDVDRSWALWMEGESEETNDLLIAPCDRSCAGETLVDLLKEGAGVRRMAEPEAIPLEPAG
jgi:hypothetical protein